MKTISKVYMPLSDLYIYKVDLKNYFLYKVNRKEFFCFNESLLSEKNIIISLFVTKKFHALIKKRYLTNKRIKLNA